MPSLYAGNDFDAAGAAVGAVERGKMLPTSDITEGDLLLGLASSGCHSNGFSLIRKIVEHAGLSYDDPAPWDSKVTVGESLLTPTKIYCKAFLAAHKKGFIKGASHITGGGFLENVPRMLPDGLVAQIDASTWKVPAVFSWLATAGDVHIEELARTFNMGIGMILIVSPEKEHEAQTIFASARETVYKIGKLIKQEGNSAQCVLNRAEIWTS
jgi:phosphoribosylaminoimidazole synthetase